MKYSAIAWLRTSSARAVWAGSLARPERQRGHLQRRDPPLTSSVQERELTRGDPHTEVLEQGAALGQREIQVAVTKLAQLTRQPQPVQPHGRVGAGRPAPAARSWLASAPPGRSCSWRPLPPQWKSSTTITDPAGSLAASFAIEAVTSADITPSIASSSAASAPNPGATA